MKHARLEHGPLLEKIASDTFCFIRSNDDSPFGGFGANQGFVVLEDSVLVFDTGFSYGIAKELDDAISSVTSKKVRYIVNSHDHSDHVFGNSFFWKKYSAHGIRILSHDSCNAKIGQLSKKRLEGLKSENSQLDSILSKVQISPPNITYSDMSLVINLDGTEMLLFHPDTGAHTLGDTLLYIPKKRVVFAGDVVLNSYFPNLADANLDGWLDTLRTIDFETYSKCVPGHGEPCGRKEIQAFSEYLRSVQQKLDAINLGKAEQKDLRSCFETDGTVHWKLRSIIDWNIYSLFGKLADSDK